MQHDYMEESMQHDYTEATARHAQWVALPKETLWARAEAKVARAEWPRSAVNTSGGYAPTNAGRQSQEVGASQEGEERQ
jgi:hypothetical protein